jgi:hypothetical protein
MAMLNNQMVTLFCCICFAFTCSSLPGLKKKRYVLFFSLQGGRSRSVPRIAVRSVEIKSTQICWDSILQTCPQLRMLDHWLAGSCSSFFMTLQKVALTDTIAKRGSVDSIRFWSCSLS